MESILKERKTITFNKKCECCGKEFGDHLPEVDDNSQIHSEYSFQYNGTRKCADIAFVEDDDIIAIVEIMNTHVTDSEDRPEPWYEVNATKLVNLINKQPRDYTHIEIQCIRRWYCDRPRCQEAQERIDNINALNNCPRPDPNCMACNGTGISYLSDCVFGDCMDCG